MTLHNPLPLFGTSVAGMRLNSRAREGRDASGDQGETDDTGFNSRAREGRDSEVRNAN